MTTNTTDMAGKTKEKKSNPLFDLINALFTNREYVYGITAETAKQNIFMVLRRLAIKYPMEANVFNDSKVNPIDVIRFFSDYLYSGVAPKWIYTSVKAKKVSDDNITPSDIKMYKSHYDVTDAQFDDAMRFFHDELIEEIKSERDFYKKINNNRTNEEEIN